MFRFASLSAACTLVLGALAQDTTAWTDVVTGITFQVYTDDGYQFGLALPENVTTDLIGQISAPSTVAWAGVSLGGSMTGSLLIPAYPDGDEVLASLRETSTYSNPSVITGTNSSLTPIAEGTYVNDTAWVYTFVCSNCILTDGTTFTPNATAATLGFAYSTTELDDPSTTDAALNFHAAGFGEYEMDIAAAKSSDYESWASLVDATATI